MNAFVTGSTVYGRPTDESDVDLVILADQDTLDRLIEESDNKELPIRFGRLNLIVLGTKAEYDAWHDAKRECSLRALANDCDIDRDEAVAIHKRCFDRHRVRIEQERHSRKCDI